MTHDFKSALTVLENHQKWRRGCDETPATDPKQLGIAIDAAIHALRIADKLMREPSEPSQRAGASVYWDQQTKEPGLIGLPQANDIYKTIRDHMLKEM